MIRKLLIFLGLFEEEHNNANEIDYKTIEINFIETENSLNCMLFFLRRHSANYRNNSQ